MTTIGTEVTAHAHSLVPSACASSNFAVLLCHGLLRSERDGSPR